MKHCFVLWALAVQLVTLSVRSTAQQNLQLILEGPFVVCENQPGPKPGLTIWLPNLQFTHYLPAFTDDLDQPLVIRGNGRNKYEYPHPDDAVKLTMRLDPNSPPSSTQKPTGPMQLMRRGNNGQQVQAYFYSENGDCSSIKTNLGGLQVAVPFPNEIWASSPTADAIRIVDHGTSKQEGECAGTGNCNYATKIVLRYKDVNLATFNIDGTCKGKKCTNMGSGLPWGGINASSELIGSEVQIELSAPPKPIEIGSDEDHAKKAFRAESKLAGRPRDLKWYDDPDDAKLSNSGVVKHTSTQAEVTNAGGGMPVKEKSYIVPLRVACQAPSTVLCKTQPNDSSAASACPK
jgi:hypothetical protein